MMRNPKETIGKLIDSQKTCFLGSVDEGGFPEIKAMLPPKKREGIKVFYFSTNTSSMRVRNIRENSKSSLYFCDRRFFRGVMLKGNAEVICDSALKEELFEAGYEMYYPLGKSDPDYCIIKFTAHAGRYYSAFKSEDFDI